MTLRRVIWLLGACGAFMVLTPLAAFASWAASATGSARASSQFVPAAATPTASVTGQQSVTVSWTATTLSGGTPASGYIVRRYDPSLVQQTILADCTSVTTNTCTENNVPAGTWTYSVQATRGNWVGAESAHSASVTVATFTITASQMIKAGANVTGGALSGFAANDPITFRLDSTSGTILTGSISSVDAGGSASGFTVTIPTGSGEGNHTIYAIGGSGATAASNSFLFDSIAGW